MMTLDFPELDWRLVGCWLLVVLCALRAEHLLAGLVWFWRRSSACYQEMAWRQIDEAAAPEEAWRVYKSHQAGKLPYLFFAVKSYRLLIWSRMDGSLLIRARALLAGVVRFFWRFYCFTPAVSVLIVVLTRRPESFSGTRGALLLVAALTLVLGCVLIAAEGTISAAINRSWGHVHHRLRPAGSSAAAEVGAILVSALTALFASFALVQVAVALYGSYPAQATASWGSQVAFSAQSALDSVTFDAPSGGDGALASTVAACLKLLWICYVVVLVTVFSTYMRTDSSRPSSP